MTKWVTFTRKNNEQKPVTAYIPLDKVISIYDTNWDYDGTSKLHFVMVNSTNTVLDMTALNIDRFYMRLNDMIQSDKNHIVDISDLL